MSTASTSQHVRRPVPRNANEPAPKKHAVAGAPSRPLKLWNYQFEKRISVDSEVLTVKCSPDDEYFACGCGDGRIIIYDSQTHAVKTTLTGHTGAVNDICWWKDSSQICSASDDRTLGIWSVENSMLIHQYEGHEGAVTTCALAILRAKILASGAVDSMIVFWSLVDETHRVLMGHVGPVVTMAFDRKEEFLLSGGVDGKIRMWKLTNGALERVIEPTVDTPTPVTYLRFSHNNNYVIASYLGSVHILLEYLKTKVYRAIAGHCAEERFIQNAFLDNYVFCSGSEDGIVWVWQLQTKKTEQLIGHDGIVMSVAGDSQMHVLVSGSMDKTIIIWRNKAM